MARRSKHTTHKDEPEYQLFMRAVLNQSWERVTELYESLPDDQFESASLIFNLLVKQFKTTRLEEVLKNFKSLNVNRCNHKGQPPILVAFISANKRAAELLYEHGANPLLTDGHKNGILRYAGWSKCDNMIALAKTMLKDAQTPKVVEVSSQQLTQQPDRKELVAKFMARRQAGINHYEPEF